MATKAELEHELEKAERKIARLEKKAEEAATEAPPEPKKEAPKRKVSLDSVEADVQHLRDTDSEDDAVLMGYVTTLSALGRTRSAKRAHAHQNEPPNRPTE